MNTQQKSKKTNYWLKILVLMIYLAFLLFLLTWAVKDILNDQIGLNTLGGFFIIISLAIQLSEFSRQIRDKQNETSSTQEKNEQITSQNLTIFNYSIQIGVLILLIFCLISYLAIQKNYQLICLDMERLNNIGVLIMGIFWLVQSIEDIIIKSKLKLLSKISEAIFMVFAILYLPVMLISPALCR